MDVAAARSARSSISSLGDDSRVDMTIDSTPRACEQPSAGTSGFVWDMRSCFLS